VLNWVSRDGEILLAVRLLQTFASSYVSIFFAVFLSIIGLQLWQIGLVLSGGLLSATVYNVVSGFLADRLSRKRLLILFGLIMTFSGLVFAFVSNTAILVTVAIISMLGYSGTFGPTNMLETVILAQSSSDTKRTSLYAIRSTVNSIATSMGSLFVGMIVLLQSWLYLSQLASYQTMFIVYAFLNLGAVFLYSQLSQKAEAELDSGGYTPPFSPETKRNLWRLSLLFSLDVFGGGLITSSLVSYWFFTRFGLNMDIIGLIFAASGLLSAVSFILAARVSERIGLVNAMVYSHVPSNIMTAAIPYMPTLMTSVGLYLSRGLLSQMDVPTRESYTMAIVKPEERSRVAGIINTPRSLTLAISPSVSGFIMQFLGLSVPFLLAGGLKVVYDFALYFSFRNVKPPHETGG